jgi:hypothetical protein
MYTRIRSGLERQFDDREGYAQSTYSIQWFLCILISLIIDFFRISRKIQEKIQLSYHPDLDFLIFERLREC